MKVLWTNIFKVKTFGKIEWSLRPTCGCQGLKASLQTLRSQVLLLELGTTVLTGGKILKFSSSPCTEKTLKI